MIEHTLRSALDLLGGDFALLCHIGGPTARTRLPVIKPAECGRVVDLDGEPADGGLGPPDAGNGDTDAGPAGLVALVAATPADFRRAVVLSDGFPSAAHILLGIATLPPHAGPPLPIPPGLGQWKELYDMHVHRHEDDAWSCELCFLEPVAPREAVVAVARAIGGGRRASAIAPLAALSGPDTSLWRPGDPGAIPVGASGPVPLRRVTPRADIALRSHSGGPPDWGDDRVGCVDRAGLAALSWERFGRFGGGTLISDLRPGALDVDDVPPIDERVVNPAGFERYTGPRIASLMPRRHRWAVVDGQRELFRVPDSGTITDVDLGRLRYLRGIRVEWSRHSGPLSAVRAVAGLAAGGVPVFSGPAPHWARCLGDDLRSLLTAVTADDLADSLTREEHSVRLRRAALRTHGTLARWRRIGTRAGVPAPQVPLVSVVVCTRRPGMLGFVLRQLARQRGVDFEVVLGLHGYTPELPEVRSAIAAFRATGHELTVHAVDGDTVYGTMFNQAVARASGSLIAKMDDDDWYSPDHLADLLLARTYSGADVVGCPRDFLYLEELDQTLRSTKETERITSSVAGGTLCVDRVVVDEHEGFRPLPHAIDSQLLLAVARSGGRIYCTHGLGYVIRRGTSGHTWNEEAGYFLRRSTRQWSGWRPSELLECEPGDEPAAVVSTPSGAGG
ncbi:hypothetical protein F4561_003678 [Lipingzhangella halophila]|uniref:Glycosyltransferase 2-like domain-containing protein n=1 Tax=Lipingzhangella halophila TaxID=1783352 RepID=A0A7W7RJP6_9ACTN|nr:glycosyltransferase [Lipingzhangella halophila]MBB4932858.1 hypothetical protein [Lipingzhangella halophila]